jgi:dynein heavy chain
MVETADCQLDATARYKVPTDLSLTNCLAEIQRIEDPIEPAVLGLNENAAILRSANDSAAFLDSVLATQPHLGAADTKAASSGMTMEEIVKKRLEQVPEPLETALLTERFPASYSESLHTVLRLEAERYNVLIEVVRVSLQDLYLALRGEIVMSLEIEAILESVSRNRIPLRWLRASYLSEYSLSEYIKDLRRRIEFLGLWMEEGTPHTFWLPGFFFPHGFLSAIKQNFCRQDFGTQHIVVTQFCVSN